MRLPARLSAAALVGCAYACLAVAGPTAAAEPPLLTPVICKPLARADNLKYDAPPPTASDRGVDILAYDLELRLDPADRSITGSVAVRFQALTNLSQLSLDLVPELTVGEVRDVVGPLTYTHTGAGLAINLRTPLAGGETDSLTIDWSGQPPRHGVFGAGLMFRTHDAGTAGLEADDVPVIANVSQPWSAHSWWPCKDHPADKALVTLAATVPESLSVVANGTLIATTTAEPGWRRYAWREEYPLPTYLVSVAISNYEMWSEPCETELGAPVQLQYHVFPQDRAPATIDLVHTCEMMSWLTGLLGPWPYPGEKYAQAEIKWIGGMEHTTATSMSQLLFTGDGRFETLFVHEMTHQWFGDDLTPAVWADIWLNEGFARYGEALWLEHRSGRQAFGDFMYRIGPGNHPDLYRGEGILADPDPVLPNLLIYDKGAWVLHMLRGVMGDDEFFAFLRAYADDADRHYGLVTTADMIEVAEAVHGKSLRNFFEPWLNTDAVPIVSFKMRRPGPDSIQLTLTQHQDPLFVVPIPVVLHCGDSEGREIAVLSQASQTFSWGPGCAVDSLSLAPDGLALVKFVGQTPPLLRVSGPRPNPAGSDVQFMLFLTQDSEVVARIYDIRGALISSENLGRLPGTGPSELPVAPGYPWYWRPASHGDGSLAAGLYFAEFSAGPSRIVRQMIRLR